MAPRKAVTPKDTPDTASEPTSDPRNRAKALLHSPGLYLGATLGTASALAPPQPLLWGTGTAAALAASWTYLGIHPGPWRWLPGQGEPWEWMCRSSRRGYRRSIRRMRRRLATEPAALFQPHLDKDGYLDSQHHFAPQPGVLSIDALPHLDPHNLIDPTTAGSIDGWRTHPQRPTLVRAATADARKARCQLLRTAWDKALPNWERGWWRPYSPREMLLRAGPLVAIPALGLAPLPWWMNLATASLATSWGIAVIGRPDPAPERTPYEHPATQNAEHDPTAWYHERWNQYIAAPGRPLPHSYVQIMSLDDNVLRGVIISTDGRPAEKVETKDVSIAFQVPPRAVNLYAENLPADRLMMTVKLRAQAVSELDEADLPSVWKEYAPYTNSELYDVESTEFGMRFKLLLPRKGSSVADVQPRTIAQVLDRPGEDATSRLHLRVLDARRIEVNEMTRNPLQEGVPLDLDALTMDEDGYIAPGRDIYGRPVKWRMLKFDPSRRGMSGRPAASAVHAFGSGTTGAGKTSLEEDLQIAQRLNGFVSWLADGKGGAGYAPWFNDIDWLLKSPLGAMLMGQAGNAVSEYRYSQQMTMQWLDAEGYTETGRNFFVPGDPFAPLVCTWDEFNEMILKDPQAPHVKPLLRGVSSIGRLSRAAGVAARIWVQIPNLDSLGSDSSANAIRDMLQSGNIALFRTARSDVDLMSLGSRTPEFRLEPLPERFPNGKDTGGLFYVADGKAQYTQSRAMFHTNPARISRQFPATTLTEAEAEAAEAAGPAGVAYRRREEYRHLDAADEAEFLRDLISKEEAKRGKNRTFVDITTTSAPTAPEPSNDNDELDDLVPPGRRERVWLAVQAGARRNKDIAAVTDLKPTNVANATRHLEKSGKLRKINNEWHVAEPFDTRVPVGA